MAAQPGAAAEASRLGAAAAAPLEPARDGDELGCGSRRAEAGAPAVRVRSNAIAAQTSRHLDKTIIKPDGGSGLSALLGAQNRLVHLKVLVTSGRLTNRSGSASTSVALPV